MAADASGILHNGGGPGANRFQRTDGDHQRGLLALQETGGLDRQARGVGESEILVEPARERRAEIERECARTRFIDDRQRHCLRIRKQARTGQLRAGIPDRDQQCERDEPGAHFHSAAGR